MPLKIFKRNKKSASSPEVKEFYSDERTDSFLLPVENLKKYLSDYHPIEENEWVATNTVNIYKMISNLNNALSPYCTDQSCPVFIFNGCQLSWCDERNKKIKTTSSEYIAFAMNSIENFLTSEETFPSKYGNPFPPNFLSQLTRVYKYIAHILCHYYGFHFEHFLLINLLPHLNTTMYHFLWFGLNKSLLETKDIEPVESICKKWKFLE